MRFVILETPFAGPDARAIANNVLYARACMRDCLFRGEAPFASHLLYTQPGVLADHDPDERELGIQAGLVIGKHAAATVVYVDRGVSPGMLKGIERAELERRTIEYRSLEP